jgi:anti-sigma factor ChrR (cupin superfamily)
MKDKMALNSDLSQRCTIHSPSLDWMASPASGVSRRMLERDGGEVGRATSIVRYAPGSAFASHAHGGGEEILVVEGVVSDEHGDYPAGSWLRSPHMSQHQPFSREGCLILVKTGHLA